MPKRPPAAFLFAFAYALAAHACLAAAADPLANIRRCAAESNDAQRLACYDQQFRVLDTRAAAAPTAAASTAAASTAAAPTAAASTAAASTTATAEQRFGMNGQVERSNPTNRPPKIDHLAGRIATLRYKPRGEFIIQLDNGQVWEEADGENRVALEAGDTVTIDTGVMGAYWLSFGKHGSVRVKRTH